MLFGTVDLNGNWNGYRFSDINDLIIHPDYNLGILLIIYFKSSHFILCIINYGYNGYNMYIVHSKKNYWILYEKSMVRTLE